MFGDDRWGRRDRPLGLDPSERGYGPDWRYEDPRSRDRRERAYRAEQSRSFDPNPIGGGFFGLGYGSEYTQSREGYDADVRGLRGGAPHRDWLDKAGDELSSWFGDPEARQRREADHLEDGSHRGRGPKGYRRSETRIREDVSDRLSDDAWLDASAIEVSVHGGEVTLNGKVASRADRRRAEDLADRVSGVVHVQNNLRVDLTERDRILG